MKYLLFFLTFFASSCFAQAVDLKNVSDADKVKILAMKGVTIKEEVKAPASAASSAKITLQWFVNGGRSDKLLVLASSPLPKSLALQQTNSPKLILVRSLLQF